MKNSGTLLVKILIVLISSSFALSSYASDDMALIDALNKAMGKVTDTAEKAQDLNGDEQVLLGFFQSMQQSPNQDTLKVAGENITYPAELKAKYDEAVSEVFLSADKLFKLSTSNSTDADCSEKMGKIEAKFDKLEPIMRKAQQLTVGDSKSRAEAYLSIIQAMPLGLIVAEINMAKMSVCM